MILWGALYFIGDKNQHFVPENVSLYVIKLGNWKGFLSIMANSLQRLGGTLLSNWIECDFSFDICFILDSIWTCIIEAQSSEYMCGSMLEKLSLYYIGVSYSSVDWFWHFCDWHCIMCFRKSSIWHLEIHIQTIGHSIVSNATLSNYL